MMQEISNDKKYVLYDSVVKTVMTNVLVERERCGKFLLYDFHQELDSDRLYFNVAAVAADLRKENIYLDMPLLSYIKFRLKRWKKRMNLKWLNPIAKNKLDDEHKTSIYLIMGFVAEQLQVSVDFFKEINDAYYGWVD